MTDEFIRFFNANFTFNKPFRSKEYGVKPNGSNKYVQPMDIFGMYTAYKAKQGQTSDVTLEDVAAYVKEHTPVDKEEEKKPCRQWIKEWLETRKANWKFNTSWSQITYYFNDIPHNKTLDDLKDALMETVYEEQLAYKVEEVKTTLNCMARDADGEAAFHIFQKITFNPNYVDKCDRFLKAMYDYCKPEESFEIWCTLWKHWAWICKRRMLGLPVVWHIWINLYGATGIGKTTMIKKLCDPMIDYVSVTNISTLFDSTREIAKLSAYYVLVFDELAVNTEGEPGSGLTEDNHAVLKSILSGDTIDVRVYGTQKQSKQKITFVPVSSANNHLYDIIFDPTSMRRFFEFHCKAEKPKSFEQINKVLSRSDVFWRGIDENLDRGYWDPSNEIGEQIFKIQSEYYPTRTTTSMWIDACHVKAGTTSGTTSYKAYTAWCRETGNRSKTMQNFVRDIVHMIPEAVDKAGRVHLDYTVADEEEISPFNRVAQQQSFTDFKAGLLGEDDDESVA